MTLVVDASAVVAALTSSGEEGTWALEQLSDDALVAPELMPYEAANILRRLEIAGELDATAASLASAELLDLPIELCPWSAVAERA